MLWALFLCSSVKPYVIYCLLSLLHIDIAGLFLLLDVFLQLYQSFQDELLFLLFHPLLNLFMLFCQFSQFHLTQWAAAKAIYG